jgi:uncharacterized protein (DUF488 family)
MQLFTLGYEARTLPQLIRLLEAEGITRLVDVRERPISRRKGFSSTALFEACRKAQIVYEWQRELGNPEEIRALWKNGSLDEGKRKYAKLIANGRSRAVERLVQLTAVDAVAIMCLEEDHELCHRSLIAERALELEPKLIVRHL